MAQAEVVPPTFPITPRKVLVIGYGNSIRGDDAFGPLVAEQLEQTLQADDIEILSRHLLTPELAANVRDASLVIFIDASSEGPVGQVVCRQIAADPASSLSMAHHLEAGGLLHWAEQSYQRVPQAYLVSTRGVEFEFADCQLTPSVAAAVQPAIDRVRELIRGHLGALA